MLDSKVGKKVANNEDIICDECGEVIDVRIEKEKLKDNSVGYYFACNHCGEKYPFTSITPRGEKYLRRMHRMREEAKDNPEYRNDEEKIEKYNHYLDLYREEVQGPYKESDVKDEQ